MISGAKLIYKKLQQNKVKDVFMYSGGAIMPLIDQFYNSNINYYINSNEHNGCNSAVGYAKSSGNPGIMIVTSGPGITNCITSMLDSTNDSTPLIVLSGQVPLSVMGTCAFQESPAVKLTEPVTKWSYCIQNIDEIPYVIDTAFYIATTGKKGCVHIDIPKCILSDTIEDNYIHNYSKIYLDKISHIIDNNLDNIQQNSLSCYNNNFVNKRLKQSDKQIDKIIQIMNTAEKPLLYIGQGCKHISKELTDFINKTKIPVTTTMHAMGIYDETLPLSLKMCGMHGSYYANMAIQNADCIIGIGARFDDRTTGNINKYAPIASNNKAIINCNIERSEINKTIKCNYEFVMDSKLFLNKIKYRIIGKERVKWLNQINIWKKEHPFEYNKTISGELKTQDVLSELNNQIKYRDDIICTFGVGNHLMMGCQFIDWRNPNRVIASGSLGVMGCSIGYSIGSQIANKEKTVICIDGDGSFNMTLNDLKTIKEYNLPIKIIIINDSKLMMVNIWEKLFFNERYTATDNNNNPDYVKLAESFGIMSIYCDNRNHLTKSINELLEYDESILCEFKVTGEECLPLVRPGKALDNMILFREYKNNLNLCNEIPPN